MVKGGWMEEDEQIIGKEKIKIEEGRQPPRFLEICLGNLFFHFPILRSHFRHSSKDLSVSTTVESLLWLFYISSLHDCVC